MLTLDPPSRFPYRHNWAWYTMSGTDLSCLAQLFLCPDYGLLQSHSLVRHLNAIIHPVSSSNSESRPFLRKGSTCCVFDRGRNCRFSNGKRQPVADGGQKSILPVFFIGFVASLQYSWLRASFRTSSPRFSIASVIGFVCWDGRALREAPHPPPMKTISPFVPPSMTSA